MLCLSCLHASACQCTASKPPPAARRLPACSPGCLQSANLERFRWEVRDEFQACGLCYTSGTTGVPKVGAACASRMWSGCLICPNTYTALPHATPPPSRAARIPALLPLCSSATWSPDPLAALPQGVLYSHRSNYLHAMIIAMPDTLDLRAGSSVLMVVPMFHANSWGLVFAAPMVGASLVLPGARLGLSCQSI